MTVKSYEGLEWVERRSTRGLVPYRRKRIHGEDRGCVEAWAAKQHWFSRVQHREHDMRWWTWFCVPATDAERASIEARP